MNKKVVLIIIGIAVVVVGLTASAILQRKKPQLQAANNTSDPDTKKQTSEIASKASDELKAMEAQLQQLKKAQDEARLLREKLDEEKNLRLERERIKQEEQAEAARKAEAERLAIIARLRQQKQELELQKLERERTELEAQKQIEIQRIEAAAAKIEQETQEKQRKHAELMEYYEQSNAEMQKSLKDGEIMITIVVQNFLTTAVRYRMKAKYNDYIFESTRAFVGVTTAESSKINPSSFRVIVPREDGGYEFTIAARITPSGKSFNLPKNAVFELEPNPPGAQSAYLTSKAPERPSVGKESVEAAKKTAEAKVAELVKAAIVKYYEYLPTEYPQQAAYRASSDVGGSSVVTEALRARFNVQGDTHAPPDTPLDRDLGSKAQETFEKVLTNAKKQYYELLPTTSHTDAARKASNHSPRIYDILYSLKEARPGRAKPQDLGIGRR